MKLAGRDGGPLLRWYDAHKRDLPWRRTQELYPVWTSEVMLQQTQVATALPYYERWMAALPTLESLAAADEETILGLWQGLGYYRRARNFQAAAQIVLRDGEPDSYEGWLKIPGVGPYTAAALASIVLGLPTAVVDGNVKRVYARLCADAATGSELDRNATAWASAQMFPERAADWNQAMMELGARVCTPRNPKCDACPVQDLCAARQSWQVESFPRKAPKAAVKRLEMRIEIPFDGARFGIRKVESARWWAGLWEFPTTICESEATEWIEELGEFTHAVTDTRIRFSVGLRRVEALDPKLRALTLTELDSAPLPAPQRRALQMAAHALGSQKD